MTSGNVKMTSPCLITAVICTIRCVRFWRWRCDCTRPADRSSRSADHRAAGAGERPIRQHRTLGFDAPRGDQAAWPGGRPASVSGSAAGPGSARPFGGPPELDALLLTSKERLLVPPSRAGFWTQLGSALANQAYAGAA